MIPHSSLNGEVSELRERVTACRKRIRLNRATHKPVKVRNEAVQTISELDSSASPAGRYTEDYSMVTILAGEQEVGIT